MKLKWISLFLAISLILSGCNGYKDIDKRFFVVEIGIDKAEQDEKKYAVTVKLAIAGNDKEEGGDAYIITEEGKTITEAVRLIKADVDKELDFGHTKMLVLGEDLVKEGIEDTLDWFVRRRDFQQIAYVGIGRNTAKEILQTKPGFERIPGNYLFLAFGDTGTETPFVTTNYLFNVRRCLTEDGLNAVVPIIEKKEKAFTIDNAAILYQGSGKLAYEMSKEETMLFNALKREYPKVDLQIDTEESLFAVSSKILKSDYKIVIPSNAKPYIDFNVDIEGVVQESVETIKEDRLKKFEELVKKDVEDKVQQLLNNFKEKGVDPYGFGLRYRATHFGEEKEKWETWLSIYPEIEFRINVSVNLMGTGIIE